MSKLIEADFVEQMVLSPQRAAELGEQGWRCYRIEYGGIENSNPEGVVWLPKYCDVDELEIFLNDLIKRGTEVTPLLP